MRFASALALVFAGLATLGVEPALADDPNQPPPAQTPAAPIAPSSDGDDAKDSDAYKALSRYEREALETALSRVGGELAVNATGKRVGEILVDNQPVFSPRDGFLTAFNFFHITTKGPVIEREVLVRPGEVWDDELIAETRRKITDPLYTTLVVVMPLKTPDPSVVNLLVVTRDIWSLRLNTLYEIQQRKLTQLSFSLSENNLFGYRKTAALAFSMDQGDIFVGPIYIDKALLGTRLRFSASAGGLFARADGAFEGTRSSASLAYPLWSSRSKWAADIGVSHFDGRIRIFRGTELDLYDNPDTAEEEAVPRIYDLKNYNLETGVTRSFGSPIIQRIRAGYDLRINRPTVLDSQRSEFSSETLDAFVRDRFPRSERSSALFFRYEVFLNKFHVFRNLESYELPEDVRIGPSFSATVASALELIGSEENFYTGSLSLSHSLTFAESGLARLALSSTARLQSEACEPGESCPQELVDRTIGATLSVYSPMLVNKFRIVGEASLGARFRDRANSLLRIGGDNGLRGYEINQFEGLRRVRANLELRTIPFRLWFGRVGGILFYDVGHSAFRFSELEAKHDVGFGLRSLVPQLQRTVFRFDLAVGLNDGGGVRFTSGINQAF